MTISQEPDDQSSAAPQSAEQPATVPSPAKPQAPKPGVPTANKPQVPGPGALASAKVSSGPSTTVSAPPSYATALEDARKFGQVDPEGHVVLILGEERIPVGQYPNASEDEALAYFVRKYDDVMNQVILLETRAKAGNAGKEAHKTIKHLRETVAQRSMVGDIDALNNRIDELQAQIKAAENEQRVRLEAARAAELQEREKLVEAAEAIAAQDPSSMQWKIVSSRMNELFETWKSAQKDHIKLTRSVEEALWKRFRNARTTFDKQRRAFFSQLDTNNAQARAAKEALISEAEALSTSTDWSETAAAYRDLMARWKESKRASKKDDDALWARFRAAQDRFFAARQDANDQLEAEFVRNLEVKEQILREARELLPVENISQTKRAMESIRDRWEEAGKVPRSAMHRIEAGLKEVEDAIKTVEQREWERSNPETQARANSMLGQLYDSIADLEKQLSDAQAKGDTKAAAQAQSALETKRSWLAALEDSAQEMK